VKWVVYAKPPFAGHSKWWITSAATRTESPSPIIGSSISKRSCEFNWRDYRDNNQQKTMTLSAEEFIRRFLLHVLPSGSTAFATTGSSAIATARRSWSIAANFSAWLLRVKVLLSPRRRRTIVIDARDLRVIHCGNAPSAIEADDHYPSSAGSGFFAGHKRHVMIHRARPQIALSKNSKPSSQRNRLVARF